VIVFICLQPRIFLVSIDSVIITIMRYLRAPVLKASIRNLVQDGQLLRRYGTVAETPQFPTPPSSIFDDALAATGPRNTWTKEQIKEIYDTPLMKLAFASVSLTNYRSGLI